MHMERLSAFVSLSIDVEAYKSPQFIIFVIEESGNLDSIFFVVLPKSAYKPLENLSLVEHLILWFTHTDQ